MCISNGLVGRNSFVDMSKRKQQGTTVGLIIASLCPSVSPFLCVALLHPLLDGTLKWLMQKKKQKQHNVQVKSLHAWDGGVMVVLPVNGRLVQETDDSFFFLFVFYFPSYLDKVN